jgi:hypothetical protein
VAARLAPARIHPAVVPTVHTMSRSVTIEIREGNSSVAVAVQ